MAASKVGGSQVSFLSWGPWPGGKFPKVPGRRRGTRGFPAAPRQRPRQATILIPMVSGNHHLITALSHFTPGHLGMP